MRIFIRDKVDKMVRIVFRRGKEKGERNKEHSISIEYNGKAYEIR
jgi:hypothetical protein